MNAKVLQCWEIVHQRSRQSCTVFIEPSTLPEDDRCRAISRGIAQMGFHGGSKRGDFGAKRLPDVISAKPGE